LRLRGHKPHCKTLLADIKIRKFHRKVAKSVKKEEPQIAVE